MSLPLFHFPIMSKRTDDGTYLISGEFCQFADDGKRLEPLPKVPIVNPATGEPSQIVFRGLSKKAWEETRQQVIAAWEFHSGQKYEEPEPGAEGR